MTGGPIRVGIVLREQDLTAWSGRLPQLAERAIAAGLDHLTVGDHVSYADGLDLLTGHQETQARRKARR